jgi:Nuclease-related domain
MRDAQPGRWARIQVRREVWGFVNAQKFPIVGFYAVNILGCGLANFVSARWVSSWLRGAMSGSYFTAVTIMPLMYISILTRSTSRWMGGDAERSVAEMLNGLPKKNWSCEHDLRLLGVFGNIDHIVIGPAGVFVLETKWNATADKTDRYEQKKIQDAFIQARGSARAIRLRMKAALNSLVEVKSVVVIDGGARSRPNYEGTDEGIVVRADFLVQWLESLPHVLDPETVRRYADALTRLPARDFSPDANNGDGFVTRFGVEGVFAMSCFGVVGLFAAVFVVIVTAHINATVFIVSFIAMGLIALIGDRWGKRHADFDKLGIGWWTRSAAHGLGGALALLALILLVDNLKAALF